MEHVLSLDELRDATLKHADMASLILLEEVSHTARQAVLSFTYPRMVSMSAQDFKTPAEGQPDDKALKINSTGQLLQRGPRISQLSLKLFREEEDWPPFFIIYKTIRLLADQLSHLIIEYYLLFATNMDSTGEDKAGSLRTIREVRLPHCTSLELYLVSINLEVLPQHGFNQFLAMFPALKQLTIELNILDLDHSQVYPLLSDLPASHLLENL